MINRAVIAALLDGCFWTAFYGILAAVCLLGSSIQNDCRAARYGLLMFICWMVSWFAMSICALYRIPWPWAMAVIIPCDGIVAMAFIWEMADVPNRQGLAILTLFGMEMIFHLFCAVNHTFGTLNHFILIDIVYAAQVLIAGGANVIRTFDDWSPRRREHSRVHSDSRF